MRNTRQYPITKDELHRSIDWAESQLNRDLIGDIKPLCLQILHKLVETIPDDETPSAFIRENIKSSSGDESILDCT